MRRKVTVQTLNQFMRELAEAARGPGHVYLTGGATALLLNFREQTIDIDLKLDPEPEGVFEAIAMLKERLQLNVEIASPDHFIPPAPDWRERSPHIVSIGRVHYSHYDLSLQALSKLERGHAQDLEDVLCLVRGGHVHCDELRRRFTQIEPGLLRYPAIDPPVFRKKVEEFVAKMERS